MKSIITIALLLSAIFSYGQKMNFSRRSEKMTFRLPSGRLVDADSMYTALEKAYSGAETINSLRDSVIMLAKRIGVLEGRPLFQSSGDGRLFILPTTTFATGTAVLDSATKKKP